MSAVRRVTRLNKVLASWETTNDDISDTVHRHFAANARRFREWWDVSNEGCRVWLTMFGERPDVGSPQEAVLAGVAGAAYDLALERVAKTQGVSVASLKSSIVD